VGTGNQTSQVTYPDVYLPDEITPEHVTAWFVGNDVAGKMAELRGQAEEWLNDKFWKTGGKESAETESVQPVPPAQSAQPAEPEYVDPNIAGGYMEELPAY
jgi:hypothetical protein